MARSRTEGSSAKQVFRKNALDAPYPSRPSDTVVQSFRDHVRRTGSPETFPTIERSPPPKDSQPVILTRFDVDPEKRPRLDYAPCAICSPFKPKAIHNLALVYYPDEGVIRVIGPECSKDLKNYKIAFDVFDDDKNRKTYENIIEHKLPNINQINNSMEELRVACDEAERIHKKISKFGGVLTKTLRKASKDNGRLSLDVNQEKDDKSKSISEIGPAGYSSQFGGKGSKTSRIDFGPMPGEEIFRSHFAPAKKAAILSGMVKGMPLCGDSNEAFEWLCSNEDLADLERVSTDIKNVESEFGKIKRSINACREFIDSGFLTRLHSWGQHPDNDFQLDIELFSSGLITITIQDSKIIKIFPDRSKLYFA